MKGTVSYLTEKAKAKVAVKTLVLVVLTKKTHNCVKNLSLSTTC